MSRITNPETENSVTCGFYNSINDRRYDAIQMSEMFDGIINDGIFASIGTCFVVNADSGNIVNVGIGKAWFNHSWTKNDAILPVTCEQAELLLDRIDAIVIEVNRLESVRDNFIKVVKGAPSSEPARPTLSQTGNVYQYPLCYIYREAGSEEITQDKITNMVGTTETPFITGILQTADLDTLLGQWRAELDQFVVDETEDFDAAFQILKDNMEAAAAVLTAWTQAEQTIFIDWFNDMKNQLSTDAAGNLQLQIDRNEIKDILLNGFPSGTKTISDDGTTITMINPDGMTLKKVFSDGFLTSTSTLMNNQDIVIATLVKTFSADGKTISSEMIIL